MGPTRAATDVYGCRMHRSRLCALLIDCNSDDIEAAATFWSAALGRGIDRALDRVGVGRREHLGERTELAEVAIEAAHPQRE